MNQTEAISRLLSGPTPALVGSAAGNEAQAIAAGAQPFLTQLQLLLGATGLTASGPPPATSKELESGVPGKPTEQAIWAEAVSEAVADALHFANAVPVANSDQVAGSVAVEMPSVAVLADKLIRLIVRELQAHSNASGTNGGGEGRDAVGWIDTGAGVTVPPALTTAVTGGAIDQSLTLSQLDALRRAIPQLANALAQEIAGELGVAVHEALNEIRINPAAVEEPLASTRSPESTRLAMGPAAELKSQSPGLPIATSLTAGAVSTGSSLLSAPSIRWFEGQSTADDLPLSSLQPNKVQAPVITGTQPTVLSPVSQRVVDSASGIVLRVSELATSGASNGQISMLIELSGEVPGTPVISARLTLQGPPISLVQPGVLLAQASHAVTLAGSLEPVDLPALAAPRSTGFTVSPAFSQPSGPVVLQSGLKEAAVLNTVLETATRTTAVEIAPLLAVASPRPVKITQNAGSGIQGGSGMVLEDASPKSGLEASLRPAAGMAGPDKGTQPFNAGVSPITDPKPAKTTSPVPVQITGGAEIKPVQAGPEAGDGTNGESATPALTPQLLQFARPITPVQPDYTSSLRAMLGRINGLVQNYKAVGDGLYNAQLELDPPALGKLVVNILVRGETVSIQVAAVSPASREQLQAGMGQLRQGLIDSGLNVAEMRIITFDPDEEQSGGQGGNDGSGRQSGQQRGNKSTPQWEERLKTATGA